ncbi:MAG: LPXTG cell wall anchor domain-containing protein [Ruminococcaceae bacterium]|nr:LPXTG cell wall anchor domain-containing protein [Oscillospiraceae bacterium]
MNKRLFILIIFLLSLGLFAVYSNKKIPPVPKTGDETNIIIWIALAAISLILAVVLIISARRKNKYSLKKKVEKKEEESGEKKIVFKAEDYE